MYVTIQVRPDVAPMLHEQQPPTTAVQELLQAAADLGVVLRPMHPGVANSQLATYFTVEVSDAAAEAVIAQLRRCEAVQAAYVKPPEAMP